MPVQADKENPFVEKVFLHTDRDIYSAGDDLWFKAYLLDGRTNRLTDHSNNLYVELIGPAATILSRALVRLDGGSGKGDLRLKNTLPPGAYRLRAYTNWMRSFGDRFVFEKDLRILPAAAQNGTSGSATTAKASISASKTPAAPRGEPSLRFFPEGGTLVAGVVSLVAVKAEDEAGRGIPALGEVLNAAGETVSTFTCDSLGMGAFVLWPEQASYRARVNMQGKTQLISLPGVTATGFGMRVRVTDGYVNVALSSNPATLAAISSRALGLTLSHTGRAVFTGQSMLSESGALFQVPIESLPEGVACITAVDGSGRPLCERLLYISKPPKTRAKLEPDKPAYQARERTSVDINTGTASHARLSVAVVDADAVPVSPENIVSYLQLRSEIKGFIEQPRRYFDTTNVNRSAQLDLLLLTQGWRAFVWDKTDSLAGPVFPPETGIDISGTVRKVGGKTPLPGLNITLFANKASGQKLFAATTDSQGRFSIPNVVLYGYQYLNFTSRSSTGIRKDGNSKGFSGGWIQVDSLRRDTLPVAYRPDWWRPRDVDEALENQQRSFSFSGMNRLREVQLTTRKQTFTPVQFSVTQKEQKEYGSLMQYLLYNIPGVYPKTVDGVTMFFSNSAPNTILGIGYSYADRSQIPRNQLEKADPTSLPMDKVLRLVLQKYIVMSGPDMGAFTYRVSVVLRPGALSIKNYFDNTVADMTGYQRARVFFSPKLDDPDPTADLRGNTIHWQPDIVTDEKGRAVVSFSNKEVKGRVRVVVQGITDEGIPISAMTTYDVK